MDAFKLTDEQSLTKTGSGDGAAGCSQIRQKEQGRQAGGGLT